MKTKTALFYTLFAIALLAFLFIMGCGPVKINEPVRWKNTEGKYNEPLKCFKERYCNYQNQNNPDKSSCKIWSEGCSKLIDFEYCKKDDNRVTIKIKDKYGNMHEGTDFHAGCWDILK